ncbi:protein phosphatase [Rhodococcus sp. NPDC058521]|uniref:protein-tyrosine phosphatase family protein n=1 Tax=Rhodococcus sp. NPDC058521 TaxID=3346536 RepID=UPI003658FBB4
MTGSSAWPANTAGLLRLPSGRVVRGRGLRNPLPDGALPDFGVYLTGKAPSALAWEQRWVRWPDFWLPADRGALRSVLEEALERSERDRIEFACGGGYGRTGTALACLAVLDGIPKANAVAYVREHYSPRAVEMPWQHRFVKSFPL